MTKDKKEKISVKKDKKEKIKKPLKKLAKPKVLLSAQKAKKKVSVKANSAPAAKKKGIVQKPKAIVSPVVAQVSKQEAPAAVIKPIPVAPVVKEAPVVAKKEAPPVKKEAPVVSKKEIPFSKPKPAAVIKEEPQKTEKLEPKEIKEEKPGKELELDLPITVKDLAIRLQEKPSVIIKDLMAIGVMAGINQSLDEATAGKLCQKYHYVIKKAPGKEELALMAHEKPEDPADLKFRAPIVTIMGHVDHGKTSLLDSIRKSKVVESEHGGITQHIGAYRVVLPHGEITFLDTPGHEAFTAMRARGASVTDIVILVVAADDGIMPQTEEAIDHARAAEVPIIVAINKIDKPGADLDKIKKQLAKYDLAPEDWGGKTITCPVSAKTGEGIDNLLEMMLLEAQMLELKANPNRIASGVVIEGKISKGRGPVATLLIKNGSLRLNENIIVGSLYGKIKAMFNDHGESVTSAGPGFPVEVLGIQGVPAAGEQFFVIRDEKEAKQLVEARKEKEKEQQIKVVKRISLEDLHAQIQEGKLKELKLIVKADVQGSLEAIKDILEKLNVSEIKISIIHAGVGNINSSDVILAAASNALIVGFNLSADDLAKDLANKEGVEIKIYNIIYELGNEIKAAVEGMLAPKIKKVFLGRAEVRKVFRLSRAGTVAGSFVTKGKINRASLINIVRNGEIVFEGKLSSLKRFKDDVRDVAEGFECGISVSGFDQIMEGDLIESYDIERIARKL
ncbi:MAG: translation initiation factor IF-2 [Candidatus Omnitrophica bacterium]|nr:translation initiation factor IF-2 [Candidatus Omnitrophota bacterium]MBU1869871.1 translation initiation factor IF-2 [Candidatus Omnitrophota bacterium]